MQKLCVWSCCHNRLSFIWQCNFYWKFFLWWSIGNWCCAWFSGQSRVYIFVICITCCWSFFCVEIVFCTQLYHRTCCNWTSFFFHRQCRSRGFIAIVRIQTKFRNRYFWYYVRSNQIFFELIYGSCGGIIIGAERNQWLEFGYCTSKYFLYYTRSSLNKEACR